MKKMIALLLNLTIAVSCLAGCSTSGTAASSNAAATEEPAASVDPKEIDNNPNGETQGRHLGIAMPTLGAPFYVQISDNMKAQAEAAGMTVDIVSADMDVAKQIEQLENFPSMGVTDIIICPVDTTGVHDTLVSLREKGINVHSFAYDFGGDYSCYDSATVANQEAIGEQNAQNASDWIDKMWPDAAEGSVETVLLTLPTSDNNNERDDGLKKISEFNKKVNVVATYELGSEDSAEVQNAIDQMMIEHPETKVVICHFASIALAADEKCLQYQQIDKSNFGIFSCDSDNELFKRIKNSVNNESLIRATGTYSPDAFNLVWEVAMGKHNDELNDKKLYYFPIVSITPDNVADYITE